MMVLQINLCVHACVCVCVQKEDKLCLEDVQTRRELLHNLVEKVREMLNDYESLKK